MPKSPPAICSVARCPNVAVRRGRCAEHAESGWKRTSTESRHKRGYGATWEEPREYVLARDSRLCQVCRRRDAEHVDHIVPKSLGGTDHPDNLRAICGPCHTSKTADDRKAAQAQRVQREAAKGRQQRQGGNR